MRSIVSLLGGFNYTIKRSVVCVHDEVEVSASKWKVIDINFKRNGPKIEPCGTPVDHFCMFDFTFQN